MVEPSEKYRKAISLGSGHHARQSKTWSGRFTWKMRHRIKELIDQFEVKSILDYGCGKGRQYEDIDEKGQNLEQYWGIMTTKYDPCVTWFSQEPHGKFDMVICVQVLGSIPRDDLPWVIDRLYRFASKVIFVSERLIIPRKQIYAEMVEDMPYGMTRDEWMGVLKPPRLYGHENWDVNPSMFFASKGKEEGWSIEEVE
jgi:hypothetical protein